MYSTVTQRSVTLRKINKITKFWRTKKMKKTIAMLLAIATAATLMVSCQKTTAKEIATPDDLNGARVAVQTGTTGDAAVVEAYPDAKVSRFTKAIDCGVDLKNGKVDAVVIDAMVARKIVEQLPELTILDEELSSEQYAIAVKKGNTELLESINKTLAEIASNGKADEFYNAFIVPIAEQKKLADREETSFGETIVMGTNAEFEPFEYRDGEKIIGYDIEIANEIANGLGKDLKIEDMAFDSLIAALTSGKVDFVLAGMSITEERKENVDFSDEYFNASQVIIVKK